MEDDNDLPAALIVTRRAMREMADGTLRVQFDVEPRDRRAFLQMFPEINEPMAVAVLSPGVAQAEQQARAVSDVSNKPARNQKGPHGQFWHDVIRKTAMLDAAPLAAAFGDDADFCRWLRETAKKCTFQSYTDSPCSGDIVAAHVRRVSQGAGTGIKPAYYAVPCCNAHHTLQHQHGESFICDADVWDEHALRWRRLWSMSKLREVFDVDSMSFVSPDMFCEWIEHQRATATNHDKAKWWGVLSQAVSNY